MELEEEREEKHSPPCIEWIILSTAVLDRMFVHRTGLKNTTFT